jgi:ADP-ribose pyrophosphatase YjhB (NUDIX family)
MYFRDGFRPLCDEEYTRAESLGLEEVEDRSVGAIVLAKVRGIPCVLVIKPMSKAVKNWVFPKGHPDVLDAGELEDDQTAATREVFEETGVLVPNVAFHSAVWTEHGYTFIKRLHGDAWKRHPAYPDKAQRPVYVTHKSVRYYLCTMGMLGARGEAFSVSGDDSVAGGAGGASVESAEGSAVGTSTGHAGSSCTLPQPSLTGGADDSAAEPARGLSSGLSRDVGTPPVVMRLPAREEAREVAWLALDSAASHLEYKEDQAGLVQVLSADAARDYRCDYAVPVR